jgi:hypothetical protein
MATRHRSIRFWNVEPESGSRMLCYVTELVEPVEP